MHNADTKQPAAAMLSSAAFEAGIAEAHRCEMPYYEMLA
jgi:hypothetical protein